MSPKYWLYDDYDFDEELIGRYDTMTEVRKACRIRDDETDGEWAPLLKTFKPCYQGNFVFNVLSVIYNWNY